MFNPIGYLSDLLHSNSQETRCNDPVTLQYALEVIQKSETFAEKDFYEKFDAFLNNHTASRKLIGQRIRFTGSGWSTCAEKSFGLTMKGIEVVLKEKQIDAVCCSYIKDLSDFFVKAPLEKRSCCVIGSNLVENSEEFSGHVITLAYFKGKDIDTLALLDCEGSKYDESKIINNYFKNRKVLILQSGQERQNKGDECCFSYVIRDCERLMFQPESELTSESIKGSVFTSEEKIKYKREDFAICLRATL